MKTIEYLEAVEDKKNIKNNISALSRELGVSRQSVQAYKKGRSTIDGDVILKFSEILDIDESIILLDMKIEKAKSNDAKKRWLKIRELMVNFSKLSVILTLSMTTVNSFYVVDKQENNGNIEESILVNLTNHYTQ